MTSTRRLRRVMATCDDVAAHPAMHKWLRLASCGWYLLLADVQADPSVSVLVSADTCWYFSYADWRCRRPRRWQRSAWRAWRREEDMLARQQARLVEAVAPLKCLRPLSGTFG